MPVVKITYKVKKTGPADDELQAILVDRWVYSVLADQQHTPDEFQGQGRKGRTPFNRSGALVKGLFFKRASAGGRRAGLIGAIRAPASRFGSGQVRDKFLDRYLVVLHGRGQAWSVTAYADVRATLERLTGMTRAQRDALLSRRG